MIGIASIGIFCKDLHRFFLLISELVTNSKGNDYRRPYRRQFSQARGLRELASTNFGIDSISSYA
jgi:hypothetical protein